MPSAFAQGFGAGCRRLPQSLRSGGPRTGGRLVNGALVLLCLGLLVGPQLQVLFGGRDLDVSEATTDTSADPAADESTADGTSSSSPVEDGTGGEDEPSDANDQPGSGSNAVVPGTWVNRAPSPAPSARFGHAMAYIRDLNQVLLFGGFTTSQNAETWIYSVAQNVWTKLSPPTSPPARYHHSMVYDSDSRRVILFGGFRDGVGALSGTWAFDPVNGTWKNMRPSTHPAGRYWNPLAYDSKSDRVVMFGGKGTFSTFSGTWTYDFDNNTWKNMRPVSRPLARSSHGMSYDPGADRVVMFGGKGLLTFSGTWTYDVDSNKWLLKKPLSHPSARRWHQMAFDARLGGSVAFGGCFASLAERDNADDSTGCSSGQLTSQTWLYDHPSNSWTKLAPPTAPSPRRWHGMAYSEVDRRTVVFGGNTGGTSKNGETWVYRLNTIDLAITSLSLSAPQPTAGDPVTISAVLVNTGEIGVTTPFSVEFFEGATSLGSVSVPSLGSGESVLVNRSWTASEGDRTLRAIADSSNSVPEVDESNNAFAAAVFILYDWMEVGKTLTYDIKTEQTQPTITTEHATYESWVTEITESAIRVRESYTDPTNASRNITFNSTFDLVTRSRERVNGGGYASWVWVNNRDLANGNLMLGDVVFPALQSINGDLIAQLTEPSGNKSTLDFDGLSTHHLKSASAQRANTTHEAKITTTFTGFGFRPVPAPGILPELNGTGVGPSTSNRLFTENFDRTNCPPPSGWSFSGLWRIAANNFHSFPCSLAYNRLSSQIELIRGDDGNYLPFISHSAYPSVRWMQLYTQSDLGFIAGKITGLRFQRWDAKIGEFRFLTVQMCRTTVTQVVAEFDKNCNLPFPHNLRAVFQSSQYRVDGNPDDWIGFKFPGYDLFSTMNLIVEIRWSSVVPGSQDCAFKVRNPGFLGLRRVTAGDLFAPKGFPDSVIYNTQFDLEKPTYKTGRLRNSGSATTPTITLQPNLQSVTVQFWRWAQVETTSTGSFDVMQLMGSKNGGPFQALRTWDSSSGLRPGWQFEIVDLTPVYDKSLGSTLRLRWFFDTIDGTSNDFEGWYIDDIEIHGQPSSTFVFQPPCANALQFSPNVVKEGIADAGANYAGTSAVTCTQAHREAAIAGPGYGKGSVVGQTRVETPAVAFSPPQTGPYIATFAFKINGFVLILCPSPSPFGAGSVGANVFMRAAVQVTTGAEPLTGEAKPPLGFPKGWPLICVIGGAAETWSDLGMSITTNRAELKDTESHFVYLQVRVSMIAICVGWVGFPPTGFFELKSAITLIVVTP